MKNPHKPRPKRKPTEARKRESLERFQAYTTKIRRVRKARISSRRSAAKLNGKPDPTLPDHRVMLIDGGKLNTYAIKGDTTHPRERGSTEPTTEKLPTKRWKTKKTTRTKKTEPKTEEA